MRAPCLLLGWRQERIYDIYQKSTENDIHALKG